GAPPGGASHEDAPRLEATVADLQRPIVAELHQTAARDVRSLTLVDAVAATVSAGEEAWLRRDPAVARVVPDVLVPMAPVTTVAAVRTAASTASPGVTPPGGACPTGRSVQLEPQALALIHAASQSGKGDTAQTLGYTGAGVRVGIVAGGIDVNNADYVRADGQHVIADYRDFSNTGTLGNQGSASIESVLDTSSIAAQGRSVFSLQKFVGNLSSPCNIRILGVSPGVTVDLMDVFGTAPAAYSSTVVQGIDWAVLHDHVNVLNESLGSNPYPDTGGYDLTVMADNAAIARGVTVISSTGDAGPTGTIGSPASDPALISTGASTAYRLWAQIGFPSVSGANETGWVDDNVSALSSGGVTQSGRTLDVVAPGEIGWVDCSPILSRFPVCTDFAGKPASLEPVGGTSEAAPLTSGTAALVIQAYREAHGGASPSPAVVKQIITSTAQDIVAPGALQGAGLVDAYAAVLAARSYGGASGASAGGAAHALLSSTSQLDAAGAAGAPVALPDTLTNDSARPVTVHLSSRVLSPWQQVDQTAATLTAADHYTAIEHFQVPAGEARLDTEVAWTTSSTVSTNGIPVSIVLLAPGGKLAGYSWPGGNGAHGSAAVADPAPGTWTAALEGGAPGSAQFLAQVATWQSLGAVTPGSLTLAPRASASFTLTTSLPATPGDEAGSIVLNAAGPGVAAFTAHTSIPVVLRAYVPTPAPTTTFTGAVTGGNGRSPGTGQTAYYELAMPAGAAVLNADIAPPSPVDTVLAELVAPDGLAASTASNSLLTQDVATRRLSWESGAQLHVLSPAAGLWTLVVVFYNRVSGLAVTQPFGVTLSTTPATVTAAALPDSAANDLPAGTPATFAVQVTNGGSSPEEYFVDARLPGSTTVRLGAVTTSRGPVPPNGTTFVAYAVPSHTTAINVAAHGSRPVVFDYSYGPGDPDILVDPAPATADPSATYSAPSGDVPSGTWLVSPEYLGPDGPHGYTKGTIATTMTATTAPFDPAVTSSTGDIWLTSSQAAAGATPVLVEPGQTVSIAVTITPTAAAGSVVTGTLYVDAYTPLNALAVTQNPGILPFASEVAALPYSYTVAAG
ncbi:MAG: S8 family serine peptidase, partial [Acidimicrobiales bacterium]